MRVTIQVTEHWKGGTVMTIGGMYGGYSYYQSPYGMDQVSGIGMDKDAGKTGAASSPEECETCKRRQYIDGSDENVSFKSAAHISPEASASRVMAHEAEHVSNAYTKASQNDGQVINASVSLHTAVCPECGRTYVSGGTTNTMIKYTNESNPYQQERKAQDALRLTGANIDLVA